MVNSLDFNVLSAVFTHYCLMQCSIAVAEDTTTSRTKAELQSYLGVAVGFGVVLALIVILNVTVVVVSVVWLKRHQWILPCTGDLDL